MTLFRQLYEPSSRAFSYLLADSDARTAVAVDVTFEGTFLPLLGLISELDLQLRYLLCTHVLAEMPSSLRTIRERTGALIVAGTGAAMEADVRVAHGDSLAFGGEVVYVLGTPGHAAGDVSYLWRDRVFTGQALLIRGCGRTDCPGADAGALFDSITQRLLMLPGETLIFPSSETHHRRVSTVAEERAHNPCVAGVSRDEFITRRCER